MVTDHECVSGKSTKLNDVADNRMAMMEIRLLLSAMILKYESWTGVPEALRLTRFATPKRQVCVEIPEKGLILYSTHDVYYN